MTTDEPKAVLHRYLQAARDALMWKLDGLSEYDVRRPLTPTGTNLLGLVKHVASVEFGYVGDTFDRPSGESLPWLEQDAEELAARYRAGELDDLDLVRQHGVILKWESGELLPESTRVYRQLMRDRAAAYWAP